MDQFDRADLLDTLDRALSEEDLRRVLYSLRLDYANFGGNDTGKDQRILKLLEDCERRQTLPRLFAAIHRLRPHLNLPGHPPTQTAPPPRTGPPSQPLRTPANTTPPASAPPPLIPPSPIPPGGRVIRHRPAPPLPDTHAIHRYFLDLEDRIRIEEGQLSMSQSQRPLVSFAAQRFARTARELNSHMKTIEQLRSEWSDLLIGDPVTAQSLKALSTMHSTMLAITNLLFDNAPPPAILRYQAACHGFINTSSELAATFRKLNTQLVHDRRPADVHFELDHYFDDLQFYKQECILMLKELERAAKQATATLN